MVPQTQEPLLQLPHKGAGPFPFPLCFLLSFLVAWGFYLFSVCGPLLVFSTCCVMRTVPFPMYLCRKVNSTCSCCAIVTPHPSYLSFLLLNRGGRMSDVLYHQKRRRRRRYLSFRREGSWSYGSHIPFTHVPMGLGRFSGVVVRGKKGHPIKKCF